MTERLDRIEANIDSIWAVIRENQRQISDLNSSISTLVDLVEIQENRMEQSMRLHEQSMRLHEESRQRADQDRALMLQLIQQIAQGRNGGN